MLDGDDWFGITYAGYGDEEFEKSPESEPNASTPHERLIALDIAHKQGIKTWVSAEPVLNAYDVLSLMQWESGYIDLWKVGKLNYHPSDIDWGEFGRRAEHMLRSRRKKYYIKDSLRAEMKGGAE